MDPSKPLLMLMNSVCSQRPKVKSTSDPEKAQLKRKHVRHGKDMGFKF